jgi:outer membrane protein assembly factor BamB
MKAVTKILLVGIFCSQFQFLHSQHISMIEGGNHHTNVYQTKALKEQPKLKWKFETGCAVWGPGLIDNGIIYFGDEEGTLHAVEISNGKEMWHYSTEDKIMSCPTIVDTLAYLGSMDGYMSCIDIRNGVLVWSYKTGSGASCLPPAFKNNMIFFGSHDKNFYVLDSKTGEVEKEINVGHGICCSPIVDDSCIYFTDWGGNLHALRLDDYTENWKFKTENPIEKTPTLDGERIYLPGGDKYIYCLNKDTGELLWRKNMNALVTHIGLTDSLLFFNTTDGYLYAMNKNTGTIRWEFKTEGKTYSRAILADNVIYFGSGDGNLYAMDLFSGRQIWKFETGSAVHRLAIDNGIIFFGSGNFMYAIE